MNTRELRVGNLFYMINRQAPVHLPTEVALTVFSIEPFRIKAHLATSNVLRLTNKRIFDVDASDISPISLTVDWLSKFGFKYDGPILDDRYTKDGEFSLRYAGNSFCFHVEDEINDNSIDIEVSYVHQLQNLYFAIKGKELQFDLQKT